MPPWLKLSSDATYCHRAGLTLRGIELMKEAIDLIRQEPRLSDQLALKLNYLANMYLAVGQPTEAESTVREAMQIESSRGEAESDSNLMTLATSLHQQGRCDEAVRLGKLALAIRRRYLGWRNDYYRQSKKVVASFKKPPAATSARAERVVRTNFVRARQVSCNDNLQPNAGRRSEPMPDLRTQGSAGAVDRYAGCSVSELRALVVVLGRGRGHGPA